MLMNKFEAREIREAMFSMHPEKSPGLNGMNPGFYQAYWDIVGGQVTDACLGVLNNEVLPELWNETHVVLIPKNESP